jgi:hypothetical protein
VKGGTVTLTGTVHSWAERQSVVAAARFTRAAQVVEGSPGPNSSEGVPGRKRGATECRQG